MTRLDRSKLTLLVLLVAGGACTDLIAPAPTFVTITEMEIANEDDSGTFLEIEVHLYDGRTGLFLGCSGELDGLEYVDESGVVYYPDATFGRAPGGGSSLTVDELIGRDVFAVVIEDDDEPCPVPTNEGTIDPITDDLIGVSPVFRGEDLDVGVAFGFGDVVWLEMVGLR
jgi:hypothetical protein